MANIPGYKDTLIYPKQHLKLAMVITKNHLQKQRRKCDTEIFKEY